MVSRGGVRPKKSSRVDQIDYKTYSLSNPGELALISDRKTKIPKDFIVCDLVGKTIIVPDFL